MCKDTAQNKTIVTIICSWQHWNNIPQKRIGTENKDEEEEEEKG